MTYLAMDARDQSGSFSFGTICRSVALGRAKAGGHVSTSRSGSVLRGPGLQLAVISVIVSERSGQRPCYPLSLGERARVRAGIVLVTDDFRPPVARHRSRRPCRQFGEDHVLDLPLATSQVTVPEPQRLDAEGREIPLLFRVLRLLLGMPVLAAVQFDGQRCFFAQEIHEPIALRCLSAELVPFEAPVPEPTPYQPLRPCIVTPKAACECDLLHAGSMNGGPLEREVLDLRPPSPRPSPPGRGGARRPALESVKPVAWACRRRVRAWRDGRAPVPLSHRLLRSANGSHRCSGFAVERTRPSISTP